MRGYHWWLCGYPFLDRVFFATYGCDTGRMLHVATYHMLIMQVRGVGIKLEKSAMDVFPDFDERLWSASGVGS